MIYRYCHHCSTVQEDGPSCLGCGSPFRPRAAFNYLQLQARLYGTTAVPKFNEGLGAWTTGKKDRHEKARQRQLIPADESGD